MNLQLLFFYVILFFSYESFSGIEISENNSNNAYLSRASNVKLISILGLTTLTSSVIWVIKVKGERNDISYNHDVDNNKIDMVSETINRERECKKNILYSLIRKIKEFNNDIDNQISEVKRHSEAVIKLSTIAKRHSESLLDKGNGQRSHIFIEDEPVTENNFITEGDFVKEEKIQQTYASEATNSYQDNRIICLVPGCLNPECCGLFQVNP